MSSSATIVPGSTTARAAGTAPAELQRLRRRARTGIWIETVGALALLLLAFALPTLLADRYLRLEWTVRLLLLASFVFVLARTVLLRLVRPLAVPLSDEELALAVERRTPDLDQALISSLQFERELRGVAPAVGDESAELKATVVEDLWRRRSAIPFQRAIDQARVRRFTAAIGLVLSAFALWLLFWPQSLSIWARRNLLLSAVDWPRSTSLAFEGAGDVVRLPQGDALTVRVLAHGDLPDQVFLDYEFAGGDRGTEPMSRTGDGEFSWTIDAVLGDATLRAQGGDALPIELRVQIVERPRIADLVVRVDYPPYMERDPQTVPPTQGELRLPKGARLAIEGRSHKPIDEAFLLFGSDQKVPLGRGDDGQTFAGTFAPPGSGLLVVDVVDQDRLGAAAPPKWLLRVGDDKEPSLDFRLRGIGASITAHARLPGDLDVRDDFGLAEVFAEFRVAGDDAIAGAAPQDGEPVEDRPPPPAFERAAVTFGQPLARSALRHETTAVVDLLQWNTEPDEASTTNPIRPGMSFSLRFGARDNFGPGEPHEGHGETMTFRVVLREKLVEDLRRRQIEQRHELQRIADEEKAAELELREIANPAAAGGRRAQVEARLRTLGRQQQALGRRVAFVGEAYQRILWEYENNRLIEANRVRELETAVTVPLGDLAREPFPATSRLVEAFAASADEATRTRAADGYAAIQRRLEAVLAQMEQAETLAALLEELRHVIRLETEVAQEVETRVEQVEKGLFEPTTPTEPRTPK